jgi:hypothetical protein
MASLAMEGGPVPREILDGEPELAAVMSGFFGHRARLPEIPDAPRVRWIQKEQLRAVLPLVAEALGLPPPS